MNESNSSYIENINKRVVDLWKKEFDGKNNELTPHEERNTKN